MGETVFFGYDQETLDREYDNRRKVPAYPEHLARYRERSLRARETLPARLDLRYGPASGETLDLFLPAATAPGGPPAPIHVFVHGGYWTALEKADFSFVALGLQPAGALVAVIDYALIPAVAMDEQARQVREAVAWLHRNGPAFGGDPDRITISGHSAGGHLAVMAMSAGRGPVGSGPGAIRAGCGISGLYDLEPIRLSYLNQRLGLTCEAARRNSPVHAVPAAAGPLVLAVGALEGDEYRRQSHALAAAWRRRGLEAQVMERAGHDHFTIVAELGDPGSALARAIRRQMGLA